MDFDYQKIKDAEFLQREERLSSQPIQYPRPMPRLSITPETQPTSRKPPVKPRRSIKCRPTVQQRDGQSNSQACQKEIEVKRIAPSQVLGPVGPLEAQTPSLRAHILLWFQRSQLPRLQTPGRPLPCWLHGFATRREAEQLLQDKQQGCFLLRLSESKIGFVLSYRGADRCRHFIIEQQVEVSGLNGQYMIAGENSRHSSLEELINYYTYNPVGPFNEMLTVPCAQPSSSSDEIAKLRVRHEEEREDERGQTTEDTAQSIPEYSATDSTRQVAVAASDSAQYAVVRKTLKKTQSLPESKNVPDTVHSGPENGIQELVVSSAGDLAHPIDAPYARVNKPPRAVQNPSFSDTDPDPSLLGAAASTGSHSSPSAAAIAEQKYWELEPLHTYEETLHTRRRDEEIDFYAMGRRRELNSDAGDLPHNHLYSEVNIKGTRDDGTPALPPTRAASMVNFTASSSRPNPSLPSRPPPKHATFRTESSVQSFGGSPGMTPHPLFSPNHSDHLQPENSGFSIYEQIPERPANSRPPLPPPNPKR
ncbi:uncharacterized protein si:ch73-109i22.2 [Colossoma macropomum]|uniref:uncharacterized protein si:ch73-109i22.2 n=1 Tax=Colossoma macropomum TaxID=42526 RepID=UPI0018653BDF|nr:uncharacterized protein si:ch73-109i22.2 [Colossoma macropomum]